MNKRIMMIVGIVIAAVIIIVVVAAVGGNRANSTQTTVSAANSLTGTTAKTTVTTVVPEAETTTSETETTTPYTTLSEEEMSKLVQDALDKGLIEEWEEEPTESEDEGNTTAQTQPDQKTETTTQQITQPAGAASQTEYGKYLAMSPEEQQEYFETFDSIDAYFDWLNKAKAEYEKVLNATELKDGTVDIGDLINGK